ncbi:zinc finger CCCH domain-containing protein 34-like [Asparagus officinalis]|uniref:zinc finger CCCH domain-containing protein 34-like n=1 Tax=Asparagus officinalis TaxID=4686 RepID=UPI00098DE977|nr:zinc finger CCCH domain-containing protein 34-like [Asparagus officinalis]
MEDEAQKRNTDCVYFLASPLTCKKGSECEYRHSENARLNPRDCWYWLNSTCLNPSCAFRHPPLEGLPATVSEATQLQSNALAPTTKANVPCYFYYNAYCIKGDQCPFLHEVMSAQKFPKAAPESTIVHPPLENKASAGSDTGSASIEVPSNPPNGTIELIKQENSKEIIQQPAPAVVLEEPSPSAESSVPDCEEPGIKSPEEKSPLPTEFMNGSPQLCPDQSSDDIVKESAEGDEWWESSPGFDVLVDDGSEQLAYEEDADYLLVQDRESEMLHRGLLPYDYEVAAGFDPLAYPDAGYLYEHGVYENFDHADNRNTPECFHRVSEHSRKRNLEPSPHRRRKPSRRRHEVIGGREVVDLRDHLRKRRRTDRSPHKRHSSRTHNDSESAALRDFQRRGWSGKSQSIRHPRPRLRERENRRIRKPPPVLFSEISRGPVPERTESSLIKSTGANFSGPKTLAQIKEEKMRAKEVDGKESCGDHIPRNPRRPWSKDFEGPKPLNELLKEKRSVPGGEHNAISGDKELGRRETFRKGSNGYESEFVGDDDDDDDDVDEDVLHEKLIKMLSS